MNKKQSVITFKADRAAAKAVFYATLAPVEATYATALADANAVYTKALALAKKDYNIACDRAFTRIPVGTDAARARAEKAFNRGGVE